MSGTIKAKAAANSSRENIRYLGFVTFWYYNKSLSNFNRNIFHEARKYWLRDKFQLDIAFSKKGPTNANEGNASKRRRGGILSEEQEESANLDNELLQYGIF